MKALGFIKTKGLVGNIDATDAMLKAADVEFIGSDTIGAGLTTVIVTGEVGAVKAATEAGEEAASRVGELFCVNVIARPHADLARIMPAKGPATGKSGLPQAEQVPAGCRSGHDRDQRPDRFHRGSRCHAEERRCLSGGSGEDRRRPCYRVRAGRRWRCEGCC